MKPPDVLRYPIIHCWFNWYRARSNGAAGLLSRLAIVVGAALIAVPVLATTWSQTLHNAKPKTKVEVSDFPTRSEGKAAPTYQPHWKIFPKTNRSQLLQECLSLKEPLDESIEDWAFINAAEMALTETLEIELGREPEGKRPFIYDGGFTGKDMREIAPLLTAACLHGTNLTATNWSGVNIANLNFVAVIMKGLNARGANLPDLSVSSMIIEGGDFSGANLVNLRFRSRGVSFRA